MKSGIETIIGTLGRTGRESTLSQGEVGINTGFSDDPIAAADIIELQAGRAGLVIAIIGKFLYRDIFGSPSA
jgi:hypothetical protein